MKNMLKLAALLFFALTLFGQAQSRIVPNQAINIKILGVPAKDQGNITAVYNVSSSGIIRMWYLSDIKASGLTTDQLARKIESLYKAKQIFTNPTVQVFAGSDEKLVDKLITVGGDVRSPGAKPHTRGMTLYSAIMAAGGVTEFGRQTEIKLYRNGRTYVYNLKVEAHRMLKIYPNDTLHVPRKGIFR